MSRRHSKNVGLIGLGIIGQRVTQSLRRRGFHVFVWNRTPRPVPNFVGSPAAIADLCDFVQIFVADDEALLEVIRQIASSLKPHHTIAAHCTVAPETMKIAAEQVQRRGARFLDAPFTGSKMAAEKGELVYYVAGDEGALQQARKFLEASSKQIVEFGEIGEATTIKLATNIVTAATVQAASEALALVAKSGIAAEKLLAAFENNAAQSATLAMKLPNIVQGDFAAHFSVKHMLKDLQLAGKVARSVDLNLPINDAAREALVDELRHGHGDDDYSSVARRYLPDGIPTNLPIAPEEQPDLITNFDPAPEPEIEPMEARVEGEPMPADEIIATQATPDLHVENGAESRTLWDKIFRRGSSDY